MITQEQLSTLKALQDKIPPYDNHIIRNNELAKMMDDLSHLIPRNQPKKFLKAAIEMAEGVVGYDRYYKVCKSCGVTYKKYTGVGEARKEICKECAAKDIGYCYVHETLIKGIKCQQCEIDATHLEHSNEEDRGVKWVECKICGYRARSLSTHYAKLHKVPPEERDKYSPMVCSEYAERLKGENNPAYGHGGKFSPFSKKFIKYTSEEEAVNKIAAVCQKSSETKIANPENNSTTIEYYTSRGMSLEQAEIALSDRQRTFTLEKCIEKYGEIEGTAIWQERQDKWQDTLNSKTQEELDLVKLKKNIFKLEGYLARGFTEDEAIKLLGETITKRKLYYSMESLKFFESFIPTEIMDNAMHSDDEWFIYDKDRRKCFFYDFKYKDVIIEYHGHVYHPNVNVLTEQELKTWKGVFGKSAEEMIEKDNRKKELAEANGFKFFYVYSNDTDERKESVKREILNALNVK